MVVRTRTAWVGRPGTGCAEVGGEDAGMQMCVCEYSKAQGRKALHSAQEDRGWGHVRVICDIPSDFPCGRLAEKVTNHDHMLAGQCNCSSKAIALT